LIAVQGEEMDNGLVAQEFTSYQGPCHYGLYGFENKVDDIGP